MSPEILGALLEGRADVGVLAPPFRRASWPSFPSSRTNAPSVFEAPHQPLAGLQSP
jgi:hypothetical protein